MNYTIKYAISICNHNYYSGITPFAFSKKATKTSVLQRNRTFLQKGVFAAFLQKGVKDYTYNNFYLQQISASNLQN